MSKKKTTKKKLKVVWEKPHPLDEAKTIGYVEGYSDGRNDLLQELIEYKLLVKNWKKIYNQLTKSNFLVK
jgi:hypothetical protein